MEQMLAAEGRLPDTIIAAIGLVQSSAAVVIGAMLVAPLMEPILATSAALVMGWHGRLLRSLGLVAAGVIALGGSLWVIGPKRKRR